MMMDDRGAGGLRSGPKFKQASIDLDRLEREYREVDMMHNIMLINMGHVEIDRYKQDRAEKYAKMVKEFA